MAKDESKKFAGDARGGARAARQTGVVKWFNDAKGYGFIAPDNGGDDLFVHFKSIDRMAGEFATLKENEHVEFEVAAGKKPGQLQAEHVVKING